MRLPEEKIEEIRNAVDIVDFISQFVQLKKRGKNYVGLCPFHSEKTPSFTVSPDKQLYHCFGCGVGGNIYNFIMQYEKVSFFEAVKTLAEYAGIELPKPSIAERKIETEYEGLFEANRFAGIFFYRNLFKTEEGKKALEYLYKRGINDSMIKKFGIGYAPDRWDGLVQRAIKENFPLELLEKAGLIIKRSDGAYYDRFRNRIMFPIFSLTGKVIAFGGRRLSDDEDTPKYINSPETKVYSKSKILYGLYQAKEVIRKKESVVLVEGYMDCISLFQAGIENVVASGGTALTGEQIKLVSNFAKTIYLVYDADSAGSKAMLRGVDLILEQGLDVFVVRLPEGEDPDSFIKKNSATEFEKLLQSSVSFIDFKAQTYQQLGKLDDPTTKAKAIRSIVESISKIPDELKRNLFLKETAARYKISEDILARELSKIILKKAEKGKFEGEELATAPGFEISAVEKDLAKILLEGDEHVLKFVFQYIKPEIIRSDYLKQIYSITYEKFSNGEKINIQEFVNQIKDERFRGFVTNVVLSKYEVSKFWEEKGLKAEGNIWKVVNDVFVKIFMNLIEENETELVRRINEAEEQGDEETLKSLLRKQKEMSKKKSYLAVKGFNDLIKEYLQSIGQEQTYVW